MEQCASESFYISLLEKMSQEDNVETNVCLITGAALEQPSIKLECGHSFNYNAIFEEVCNQKNNRLNGLEVQKLEFNQIKCPYCRTIHNTLLPLFEGETKISGVNWPRKYTMFLYRCSHKMSSGKRKGMPCGRQCNDVVCPIHKKSLVLPYECNYILNSGKRKGQPCNRKSKTPVCPRHKSISRCKALLVSGQRKGKRCLHKAGETGLCYIHKNKNKDA